MSERRIQVSDEQHDQIERADRADEGADVEGHSFDQVEKMEQIEATEEPPDVEGHQMGHVERMDP
jgi:hypothetical protein